MAEAVNGGTTLRPELEAQVQQTIETMRQGLEASRQVSEFAQQCEVAKTGFKTAQDLCKG